MPWLRVASCSSSRLTWSDAVVPAGTPVSCSIAGPFRSTPSVASVPAGRLAPLDAVVAPALLPALDQQVVGRVAAQPGQHHLGHVDAETVVGHLDRRAGD